MVKKSRKIELVLFYSEEVESLFYAEVIRHILGYHNHQALGCMHLIEVNGVWPVKILSAKDREKAEMYVQAFAEQGIVAKIRYK